MRWIFCTTRENCIRTERLSFSLEHAVVDYLVRQIICHTKPDDCIYCKLREKVAISSVSATS